MSKFNRAEYENARNTLTNPEVTDDVLCPCIESIAQKLASNDNPEEVLSDTLLMFDGLEKDRLVGLVFKALSMRTSGSLNQREAAVFVLNLVAFMEFKYPDSVKELAGMQIPAFVKASEERRQKLEVMRTIDTTNALKLQKIDTLCTNYLTHLGEKSEEKRGVVVAIQKGIKDSGRTASERLFMLEDSVKDPETMSTLTDHRSKGLKLFFERVLHVLSLGLYSKANKGTFKFWKSHAAVLRDNIGDELSKPEAGGPRTK